MREKGGAAYGEDGAHGPAALRPHLAAGITGAGPVPGGAGRLPGAIGIACAVVALLVCGPDNLVIPSMVLIFASLLIGRKKLCA